MELDDKTKKLIAIGASVTANCRPCLETHAAQAQNMGITPSEIELAIRVGQSVRSGAAKRMDELIESITAGGCISDPTGSKSTKCCC